MISVAVLVFGLWQPKQTIEFHRERIAQLSDLRQQTPWREVLSKITGIHAIARSNYEKRERQISWHMDKLRELEFWAERDYLFTNRALTVELVRSGATELIQNPSVKGTPFYFYSCLVETNGSRSNVFWVKVPDTDISRWDEFIRKVDVPENGN